MAQPNRHGQEEEVVPAIRHEDAEREIIQQNTFTRWVNNHLQKVGESIGSLYELSDGLKLIALAQVLSRKKVKRVHSQNLENVSLALIFFQNEENIDIINIDSTHIVDQNKKMILDLVKTLILHYSISMGWIQEKREDGQQEETPKQKLLNWIRNRLPGLPISNFTVDWRDGVALGALVNSMAPGALQDCENWSPNEALENTEKAMKVAQDLLKVAPLIAPAEMIHPDIDEMSVMTYLSQFPATKPVILEDHSESWLDDTTMSTMRMEDESEESSSEDEEHVQKTAKVGESIKFTVVDAIEGPVEAIIVDPNGKEHRMVILESSQPGEHSFEYTVPVSGLHSVNVFHRPDGSAVLSYTPTAPGVYKVGVLANGEHIQDSPFVLRVTDAVPGLKPSATRVTGIDENKVYSVGEKIPFRVDTSLCGVDLVPKVEILDPSLKKISHEARETTQGIFEYTLIPELAQKHKIDVSVGGVSVPGAPFSIKVKEATDASKLRIYGPGVEGPVYSKEPTRFTIDATQAGPGAVEVALADDHGEKVDLDELEKGYKVRYTPLAPGSYFASIKYNGIHAPGSPFKIPVEGKELGGNGYNETSHVKIDAVAKTSKGTVAVVPEYQGDASKVTAKGAGLNKFFPGRPAAFQIDTGLAGTNLLMVGVVTTKGPCEEVVVRHQGSGHYVCSYRIPDRVKGFVFIKYGDKEIPGSPFAIEP